MKKRDWIAVLILSFVTFGIYAIYWLVASKIELNEIVDEEFRIPTAWILLIPCVGWIWFLWKYAKAASVVLKGEYSDITVFLLMFLLECIGFTILQSKYNTLENA